MASYHFSAQIIGRGSGRSSVSAAAYRAGEKLRDDRNGRDFDYSRRRGVSGREIIVPEGAASWLSDRSALWNRVESLEKRKDAQLAREFNMALPHELTHAGRTELVRGFVRKQFVQRGMVADIAWHDPVPEKGDDPRNFHAHVMLPLRRATPEGLDPVKTRAWNSRELLGTWRAAWALACNTALERAGRNVRVDHRTLKAQRDWAVQIGDRVAAEQLNREPEIHVGPRVRKMARQKVQLRSQVREVGPYRKVDTARPTERRVRDYPAHDRGNRLTWLEGILAGNNEKLKRDLLTINRRFDRMSRKLDYWERRAVFNAEGLIKGRGFRFDRWKAAQEQKAQKAVAKQRAAHAQRRIAQLRRVLKELEMILAGASRSREKGLVRAREVEEWVRQGSRSLSQPSWRNRVCK